MAENAHKVKKAARRSRGKPLSRKGFVAIVGPSPKEPEWPSLPSPTKNAA